MESNNFTRDILLCNRTDKLSEIQRIRYELLRNIDHIVNSAIADKREISTGHCNVLQYSEFISLIYSAYNDTVNKRSSCCAQHANFVLFDGLMRIADYAYVAIKNIVNNPSKTIAKVDVKVLASRATGFGNKTMRWLSERPGLIITEKIAPENKVLTTKTVFTLDTKENREFMYLYKRLHEIVSTRLVDSACAECNRQHECGREWLSHMKNLMSTYSRLRTSELGEVKGEKQAVQNNKLMCDLHYKIIWDAVRMISHSEENAQKEYDTLYERLAQLAYWILLGRIMADERTLLHDCIGRVVDIGDSDMCSLLSFWDVELNKEHTADVVVFRDSNETFVKSLRISLEGQCIKVVDMQGQAVYELNVLNLLDLEDKV